VLDLCLSLTSHLPKGRKGWWASCIGGKLNSKDIEANSYLIEF